MGLAVHWSGRSTAIDSISLVISGHTFGAFSSSSSSSSSHQCLHIIIAKCRRGGSEARRRSHWSVDNRFRPEFRSWLRNVQRRMRISAFPSLNWRIRLNAEFNLGPIVIGRTELYWNCLKVFSFFFYFIKCFWLSWNWWYCAIIAFLEIFILCYYIVVNESFSYVIERIPIK